MITYSDAALDAFLAEVRHHARVVLSAEVGPDWPVIYHVGDRPPVVVDSPASLGEVMQGRFHAASHIAIEGGRILVQARWSEHPLLFFAGVRTMGPCPATVTDDEIPPLADPPVRLGTPEAAELFSELHRSAVHACEGEKVVLVDGTVRVGPAAFPRSSLLRGDDPSCFDRLFASGWPDTLVLTTHPRRDLEPRTVVSMTPVGGSFTSQWFFRVKAEPV